MGVRARASRHRHTHTPTASCCHCHVHPPLQIIGTLAATFGSDVGAAVARRVADASCSSEGAALARLRCLCAAAAAAAAPAGELPAHEQQLLRDVGRAQFALLRRLARSRAAPIRAGARAAFRGCVLSRPQLAGVYCRLAALPGVEEVACEAVRELVLLLREAGVVAAAATGAVKAPHVALTAAEWTATVQPRLLESAVRLVTSTAAAAASGSAASSPAAAVSVEDVAAMGPLLATATPEQVRTLLLPALGRALKTRPDAVLPLAAHVLGALTVDVGAAGLDEHVLPAVLVAAVCGTRDDVRAHAAELARAAAAHVADAAALARCIAGVSDTLVKKKATVPLWQARQGLVRVLHAVVAGARGSCVGLAGAPLQLVAAEALTALVGGVL